MIMGHTFLYKGKMSYSFILFLIWMLFVEPEVQSSWNSSEITSTPVPTFHPPLAYMARSKEH